MSRRDNERIEEYLRYARDSQGIPEDYEDWALDNNIKLPPKKRKTDKEEYDDSE